MATLAEMIAAYLDGTVQLGKAVAGMTSEQLKARPVAGKWSTLEVVCHLADFDPILADRMKRVLAEDNPSLIGADEKRFAAALGYHDRDAEEELTLIDKTRSQMARILRGVPPAARQPVGSHNERGPLTLEQLLRTGINHIPHHVQLL